MPSIRKRQLSILFLALALVATAMTWYLLASRPPEPTYKDKPLNFWLKGYASQATSREWQDADEAVIAIGTNGIPTMLRMLRAKDSRLKTNIMLLLIHKQALIKNPFTPAARLNLQAAQGINRLGIDATNAVPDLVQIFEQNISSPSRTGAAYILGGMGPAAREAVPSLLRVAKSLDPEQRTVALDTLGKICVEPEKVVPLLTTALQDPDVNVRRIAAMALLFYKKSAGSAVPVLIQTLNDPDYDVRRNTLRALDAIDPAAAKKARADEYKR